jgi:hypothetical protein
LLDDSLSNDIIFIPPGMENTYISEHFQVSEFQSGIPKIGPHGKYQPVSVGKDPFIRLDPKLIEKLEAIRAAFEEPITITSGYRSPAWNQAVGGERFSQHMAGRAADFQVRGVAPGDVYRYTRRSRDEFSGGLGKYSGFTHIDVGATREWQQ